MIGRPGPFYIGGRRDGDPASLLADASLARKELGWEPRLSNIQTILMHAWAWEQFPSGFSETR